MNDKLNILLENKSFNELNEGEKEFVKAHISEEEYTQLHINISELRNQFNNEIDDIDIDNNMLLKINDHIKPTHSIYQKLLSMQVSLIKVAAIFVFTFIFYTLFLLNINRDSSTNNISIKQSIIDSIPKEVVINEPKSISNNENKQVIHSNMDSINLAYIAKATLNNSKNKKQHRLQNNKNIVFNNDNSVCQSEFGEIM